MATEIGTVTTGHLCFHRSCPGEIEEVTEMVVGSGKSVTYRCSACRTEYEKVADGGPKAFEEVSPSFEEDKAPWPVEDPAFA
ncbi:MAG: hypothetical protein WC385_02935 [Candidatus Paceibacterota bacterium]|jgi:hypothetical protein